MPRDALVPPLVLQPLLENAVYHGIEPSSARGVIAINIFLRRGEVHAILRNPFQSGSGHRRGNKMALANIRERLALHFDAEAGLESKVNRETYEVHIRMMPVTSCESSTIRLIGTANESNTTIASCFGVLIKEVCSSLIDGS